MICSHECTLCEDCEHNILQNVCPNCGGGFEKRLTRPTNCFTQNCIEKYPVSTKEKFRSEYFVKPKFNKIFAPHNSFFVKFEQGYIVGKSNEIQLTALQHSLGGCRESERTSNCLKTKIYLQKRLKKDYNTTDFVQNTIKMIRIKSLLLFLKY